MYLGILKVVANCIKLAVINRRREALDSSLIQRLNPGL
jgi:hypothetical protein